MPFDSHHVTRLSWAVDACTEQAMPLFIVLKEAADRDGGGLGHVDTRENAPRLPLENAIGERNARFAIFGLLRTE